MANIEEFILHVLIQLAIIVAAARAGAWLLGKIGQPQVVGEIVAGLMLGPSLLGRISPETFQFVFPDDTAIVFRVLSELGLVLLMFLIGLEFDFSHLRQVGGAAIGVAVAGITLPFALGIALAIGIHPIVAADTDRTGFMLIMAVAMSITAIPILGRIMIELNIQRTRLGTLTITAAAIDDGLGWILLAAVSALIHGQFQVSKLIVMGLLTIGFVAGCWWLMRPLLNRGTQYLLRRDKGELSVDGLAAVLVVVFVAAVMTNAIGIFSIFGPFILGAMLSDQIEFRDAVSRRLKEIVYAFFMPIFFTYTGLRTNVGSLDSWTHWGICGLVVLVAIAGKMIGCGIAARIGGFNWRESGCVALMMNTRALMGLIAINVGRDLGVIPDSVFCMLVIMALLTTFLTTPLLRRLLSKNAVEQNVPGN